MRSGVLIGSGGTATATVATQDDPAPVGNDSDMISKIRADDSAGQQGGVR